MSTHPPNWPQQPGGTFGQQGDPRTGGSAPPQHPQYGPPGPYGAPMYSPPGPPPRRGRRTLLIVLAAVVCVGVVTAGAITFLDRKDPAGRSAANPGSKPPPATAVPARKKLYGKPPNACALMSGPTLESVYPGAKGEEDDQDTQELENNFYTHSCDFSAGGKGDFGMRFMTYRIQVMTGQGALSTTRGTYPDFVAQLPKSVNIPTVEGQKTVPGYGEEAHLIYGIDSENCRSAFLFIRSQNATILVHYGGCNRSGGMELHAIDQTAALNGVYTVAHEVMAHLVAA